MLRLGSCCAWLDGIRLIWKYGVFGGIPLRVERAIRQQAEGEGIEVVWVEPPCLMQVLPAKKVRSRW